MVDLINLSFSTKNVNSALIRPKTTDTDANYCGSLATVLSDFWFLIKPMLVLLSNLTSGKTPYLWESALSSSSDYILFDSLWRYSFDKVFLGVSMIN